MVSNKRIWNLTDTQQKVFRNLWSQVERVFDYRTTNGQGYRGKERYREGLRAFCKHLAVHYGSKHFKNVSDKHLRSFIEASVKAGVSTGTLKTDLSAIRKLHEKTDGTRRTLSDNATLGYTERRSSRGVDRAWRDSELQNAIAYARATGRIDVAWSIGIARYCGLRIEEVTALTKSQIRRALSIGYLALRITKGGIPRDVPISDPARLILREVLETSDRERVFVDHGRAHHQQFKSIQNWIYNHRDIFAETCHPEPFYIKNTQIEERPSLTFHGIRHAYAREQYQKRIGDGMRPKDARKEVAVLLGHGRDDVTRIYLGRAI